MYRFMRKKYTLNIRQKYKGAMSYPYCTHLLLGKIFRYRGVYADFFILGCYNHQNEVHEVFFSFP